MSLTVKNLNKSFGNKEIFKNFSAEFDDTGAYAVVGESGVGKTTLLRMIAGLDKAFDGEILGGGIKNTAVAFQEYRLFPELSALDNIIFANHDKKTPENAKEAQEMLLSLGFREEDLFLYPHELSGGMKQRVSVARAILRKTPLLLLDEPTKELDPENALKLLSVIKDEAKRRTVIIITHKDADVMALGARPVNI